MKLEKKQFEDKNIYTNICKLQYLHNIYPRK